MLGEQNVIDATNMWSSACLEAQENVLLIYSVSDSLQLLLGYQTEVF